MKKPKAPKTNAGRKSQSPRPLPMNYGTKQQHVQQSPPVISTSLSQGTAYARPVPLQPHQQAQAPPAHNSQQGFLSNEAHQALSWAIWSAMRSRDGSIEPDFMARALATGLPEHYVLGVARSTREQETARHVAMQQQGNAGMYYGPWQPQWGPNPSHYHQRYQQEQVAQTPPVPPASSLPPHARALKSALDNLDQGRRQVVLQAVRSAAQSPNGIVAPEVMQRALASGLSELLILNTVEFHLRKEARKSASQQQQQQQQQQQHPASRLVPRSAASSNQAARSSAPSNPAPPAKASSVPAPSTRAPSNPAPSTVRATSVPVPFTITPSNPVLVPAPSVGAPSNQVPSSRASSAPPDTVTTSEPFITGNECIRTSQVSCQGGIAHQEDSKAPARTDRKRASSACCAPMEGDTKHARRKQRRANEAVVQDGAASFNGVIGIEGIGQLILSFVDFRTLHLVRVNSELLQLANEVMESSALQVTPDDVAAGVHVRKLRLLVKVAKPGQMIRLAGGEYLLGDESVPGHADQTILYDMDGEQNGGDCGYGMYDAYSYSGDCYWNGWQPGYGPITLKTPGIKLTGPSDSSEEPAIFVFNATYYWSEDPVAIHVDTKGVTIENISFRGPCEAIHVGLKYYDEEKNDFLVKHGSVLVKNCRIQGSVCLLEKSEARVHGCHIYDHTPFIDEERMKAAVSVGFGASLHLEKTSIVNSRERHPTVESRLAQLGCTMGGLYVGGHAYLKDVSITGNFPAGLVIGGKVMLGARVNIADNWGEPTACAEHPDLKDNHYNTPCCGNVCFIDKENALKDFHWYFQCDGSPEGLESLGKVVQLVLEQTK